jgi:hypothetical protein
VHQYPRVATAVIDREESLAGWTRTAWLDGGAVTATVAGALAWFGMFGLRETRAE